MTTTRNYIYTSVFVGLKKAVDYLHIHNILEYFILSFMNFLILANIESHLLYILFIFFHTNIFLSI